jgi:hypothetical protein
MEGPLSHPPRQQNALEREKKKKRKNLLTFFSSAHTKVTTNTANNIM